MPINYQLGKIYKLVSFNGDMIYIGSTCLPRLCTRFQTHVQDYKSWQKDNSRGKVRSYVLFDEYGYENCQIILLENVKANNKDELRIRERYYIETMDCINKNIPNRTDKESNKAYRDANKEVINEKQNMKCICDVCGFGYTQVNKLQHFKSKKHINAIVVVDVDPDPQLTNTPEPQHLTV